MIKQKLKNREHNNDLLIENPIFSESFKVCIADFYDDKEEITKNIEEKQKHVDQKEFRENLKEEIKNELIDEFDEKLTFADEFKVSEEETYAKLKLEIEKIMEYNGSVKLISKLLQKILNETEVFDKVKHFMLIELLIETLKELGKPDTPNFRTDNEASILREHIIDFLFRFKDKHPFSDPEEAMVMDVFDIVIKFLFDFSFKPSASLLKEYTESELNKMLNTLPTREYLNKMFEKYCQMSEEAYNKLQKRFYSRPPFILYFNPSIQLQEKVRYNRIAKIGFFKKGGDFQIGAGIYVYNDGEMYQGYFKDDYPHIYGRRIYLDGSIYEGEFDMDYRIGKGVEYYDDGRREIGYWDKHTETGYYGGYKQGEFECYYKNGKITKKKYCNGEEVKS